MNEINKISMSEQNMGEDIDKDKKKQTALTYSTK